MSKAEEFIKAKTRIGSNTTKGWRRNGVSIHSYSLPWLTPDQARTAVGIAREEIYKWLLNHNDYITVNGNTTSYDMEKLVKDLRQAMKNE